MRTVVIILVLIFMFLSGSFCAEYFIEKDLAEMADDVNDISSAEDLKGAMEKWENLSQRLEIIIDHGDLEEVSKNLWAMEEELKYDFDEFMESKALTMQMLSHIKERNTLHIINVL